MADIDPPGEERSGDSESTAEVNAQERGSSPAEAAAVDAMLLGQCSARVQKVAVVVGKLLYDFDTRFPHLPFACMQARLQELEGAGRVEIAGDVWSMRHSEVRLISGPGEA